MSGEYRGWGNISQPWSTAFVEWSERHEAAHCPHKTRRPSDLLVLDVFVQFAVFNLFNCEQYFSKYIVWLFGKSSSYRIPFQSHRTQSMTSFGWRSTFAMAKGDSIRFLKIFSVQHYYK